MKYILLTLSLAVNAVLFAGLAAHRFKPVSNPVSSTSSASKSEMTKAGSDEPSQAASVRPGASTAPLPGEKGGQLTTWDRLISQDPVLFESNLRAVGFSLGARRGAVYALLRDQQTQRRVKIFESTPAEPYWKTGTDFASIIGYTKEVSAMWQERAKIMRDIFPEEKRAFELTTKMRYGPLPYEKLAMLSALDTDYADMRRELMAQSRSGIFMPWRADQLTYLEREKRSDVAAVLSPEELEQYDMRVSTAAVALRRQAETFQPTESEFREIVRLRTAFDTKFGSPMTPADFTAPERQQAQKELAEAIKTAIGAERYSDYERTGDHSFQTAYNIAQRLQLPAENATAVYQLQRDVRQREAAIQSDASQNPDQRAAQLRALSAETDQKLTALLTPKGKDEYRRGVRTFTTTYRASP